MMGSNEFLKWENDLTVDDWLQYSYYDLEEGQSSYHPEAYTCTGHGAADAVIPGDISLPMTDAIQNIADTDGDGVISNWEFVVAIDPTNVDGNDYVFDNFQWDHCT